MGRGLSRGLALAVGALAALALLVTPALASKEVVDFFGQNDFNESTDLGAELRTARDVAVNSSGAGLADAGDIYVADQNNNRIQRFDSEGDFISAWGANVLTPGVNEVQTLTVNATAGTYKLSFAGATTGAIAHNASAAALQTALRALTTVGGENLFVQGTGNAADPFAISFTGNLAATNLAQVSVDAAELTGSASTATTTQGSGKYELCTVASECRGGVASGAANVNNNAKNGALSRPEAVVVDEDTGRVYVSDRDSRRVNVYDGAGAFIASYGFDVDASTPGVGYEVCTETHRCQPGIAGSGAGQIGATSTGGMLGLAVSPPDGEAATGTLFLADSANRRVNTYALDGSGPASLGSAAQFGTEQPRQVAVDSRGILYASDSEGDGEIERYDTEDANGGGVGFLEPIGAAVNESQTVHFTGFEVGDTFTLTCPGGGTTEPIEWRSGSAVWDPSQAALLAKCGADDLLVGVTAGDLLITYVGAFAETDVPQMTCTTVSGTGSCEITEEVDGHAGALLDGLPATATAGLEVDPDSDEGGPDADVLYVLRDPASGPTVVQQFGPANAPGLAVAPAADDDRHGEGADFGVDFGGASGLGLDPASERLYVAARQIANVPPGEYVYVLEETPPPEASIDPVSEIEAHSATFSGTVDPNGALVGYHFEYVEDAEFEANGFENAARVPAAADVDAGGGTDPVAVQQVSPHTLEAGTEYHVRLVAKHVFSAVEAIGGPVTFITLGSAPSAVVDATGIGTDTAILRAAIDPENEAVTDYHFEWGTDTGYGNATPAGDLPAGADPVAVSEELTGLTPGQTYHYRLLATNGSGTTTGPDRTFTTYSSMPGLGPERAYELASHYPTGNVPILPVTARQSLSEDGDRMVFSAVTPLVGSVLPPLADDPHTDGIGGPLQYRSLRGADAWHVSEVGVGGNGWSQDGTRLLTVTSVNGGSDRDSLDRLDLDDQNGRFDVYQVQPDGSLLWISRDPRIPAGTPQAAPPGEAQVAVSNVPAAFTMSADGRTVVFSSQRSLDDADTTPGSAPRLYKWTEGEGARFIGARPDGSVPAGGSRLGDYRAAPTTGVPTSPRHAVSRDGSRVVFSALRNEGVDPNTEGGTDGAGIYVQTDGEPTVEATKETGVASLPAPEPQKVIYRGASADASRIFFTTISRLTPDAGGALVKHGFPLSDEPQPDLYLYDLAADKVRDLTPRLDGIEDPEVDPAAADRARVRGVAANSEDGKRVYFVADAQYDTAPNPLGELPSPAGRNLYLAVLDGIDDPIELRFIGALAPDDDNVWQSRWHEGGTLYGEDGKSSYASPDGLVLGFGSRENLTGQSTGGKVQLFVYDAEAGTLECPSCPSDGSLPVDNVNEWRRIDFKETGGNWQGDLAERRWVASDGTVFFQTATPLLAADENTVSDAYEYRAGELRLVSSGKGTTDVRLETASRDGRTVLFNTLEALVPKDKEPGVGKLYVARVGGGFPFVPEPAPCDLGAGACEGLGTGAPTVSGAGTAVFRGPGNAAIAAGTRCTRMARAARRLGNRAKRLRRVARRAGRAGDRRRARRLRRRAGRTARAARSRSIATRRCRRVARGTNVNRRGTR